MEITGKEEEVRLLYVERELKRLRRIVDSSADKAKAAAEQQYPLGGDGGGGNVYRGQVIVAIPASSGATLGTSASNVRLQTTINGIRYNKTDGTAGNYTDETVYSDISSIIPVKTYILYEMVQGVLTVIVGSCTASASFSADDITAPGG